jgi:hypothetical protein
MSVDENTSTRTQAVADMREIWRLISITNASRCVVSDNTARYQALRQVGTFNQALVLSRGTSFHIGKLLTAKREAAPSMTTGTASVSRFDSQRGIPTIRPTSGVADRTLELYFAVAAGSATRQMPRPCVAA